MGHSGIRPDVLFTLLLILSFTFLTYLNPIEAIPGDWIMQCPVPSCPPEVSSPQSLFDVHFVDNHNGWAVSFDISNNATPEALVLHTSDGGMNWEVQTTFPFSSSFGGRLLAVDFLDATHGYVGGSAPIGCDLGPRCLTVKGTSNGGLDWTDHSLPGVAHAVEALDFVDFDNGWLVSGDNEIRHTSNGGLDEWPFQLGPGFTGPVLTGIEVANDLNNGWAVGRGPDLFRTIDGGLSWVSQIANIQPAVLQTSASFEDVDLVDANTAWAVGQSGLIIKTINGGADWTQQTSNSLETLNAVDFIDENNGWVVGDAGTILRTFDGGDTWVQEASGTSVTLRGVSFVKSGEGWAVGDDGTILHRIIPPPDATQILLDSIESLEIGDDLKVRLSAPISHAVAILSDNNANNDRAVCAQLSSFIISVGIEEQNGQITMDDADELIQQAESIKTSLGCV